jgi:hypothetical protein
MSARTAGAAGEGTAGGDDRAGSRNVPSVSLAGVDLTVCIVDRVAGVNPAEWDALDHGPAPFLEHGFLLALERSGSIGGTSGWDPALVLARTGAGRLVGAVAAFVKHHSYGEYIFDWGWAEGAERAGIAYYPKLVVAAPMTPATGRRILLDPALDPAARRTVVQALVEAVRELADRSDCGSIHWLFCTPDEQQQLAELGFAPRASFQYHWRDRGWASFDDFLGAMSSRRRKQVRRERTRARDAVEGFTMLSGAELSAGDVTALDRFYRTTTRVHGGHAYLRPGFFEALVELVPDRMRWLRVDRGGRAVAGALFFETGSALYGRYWGCVEPVEFLHFEAAYYAGIEHCIARGIPRFEAGAQGEHKLLRGFEPTRTHSVHWIRHPALFAAVREFLRDEARAVGARMQALARHLPFRAAGPAGSAPEA